FYFDDSGYHAEQCDDGNTANADANGDYCDSNCTYPYCGNGIVDTFLGEQCDDGNLVNGDGCSADCRQESLIPGGGAAPNDCAVEWLTNAVQPLSRAGWPQNRMECSDGDPSCDVGPAGDGACTFHVALCFNVPDARLACRPADVRQVDLIRPGIDPQTPVDTVNRNALESALQSVGARVQGVCINRKPLRGCSANADCDSAFGAGDGRCRRIAAFEPPLSGPM